MSENIAQNRLPATPTTAAKSIVGRVLAAAYGMGCYVTFLGTFLYAIGFVGNLVVPKSLDRGRGAPLLEALMIDVLLLGVFALQHSVMARPEFKKWWTRIVPRPIERSTYVLFASLALILLFWQWRPIPAPVWSVEIPVVRGAASVLFAAGWLIVLSSTFMINHFDLFGLRQIYLHLRNQEYRHLGFRTPVFYRFLRHPIMLGFLVAFWAAPVMTVGHLLFTVATTAYILIAIQLEEHDLARQFGERYAQYKRTTSMFLPRGTKK